jgi:hypothetical protein
MLHAGDAVPHFEVTTLQGRKVEYSTIWQRRNLVLISVPPEDAVSTRAYTLQLATELPAGSEHDTEWVVTRDIVAGLRRPGVLVADRWGEIVHVAAGPDVADLPRPDELSEWITYLQRQCPECEGEAK